MRYFRFYGKIAEAPDKHDENTIEVLKKNVDGLKNISGERIWVELKKTLQGKFAGSLLKIMVNIGVGRYIGWYILMLLKTMSCIGLQSRKLTHSAI